MARQVDLVPEMALQRAHGADRHVPQRRRSRGAGRGQDDEALPGKGLGMALDPVVQPRHALGREPLLAGHLLRQVAAVDVDRQHRHCVSTLWLYVMAVLERARGGK